MDNIFYDIGLVIVVATFLAYFAGLIRQPLVLAYLFAGVAIGPVGLKLISNTDVIMTLAEIGIAFFLFIVGLEMSLNKLRKLGKPILLAGIGQIIISFFLGYRICLFFFDPSASFVIALALAFSSTMVVLKFLSDKREIDTLHGRIIIGILLIQDIVAIFAISLLSSGSFTPLIVGISLVKGVLLISLTFFISIFAIPHLFKFASKSRELVFISSVAWLFLVSMFAHYLGFSVAIGAFIAGINLAQLDVTFEIVSKVRPIRDFFSIMFFVALGMMIVPAMPSSAIVPIVLLALFVVIGNPIIVMIVMGLLGFSKKPMFLTGIGVGQASEFSLIIATQAFIFGRIGQETLSIIAVITAITLVMTSYIIKYDKQIYLGIRKSLRIFEFRKKKIYELAHKEKDHFDAVLFGCDRVGFSILNSLKRLKYKFLVVDFNPEIIQDISEKKISCIYGDFDDPEILNKINLKKPKLFISTVPDYKANRRLIKKVRETNQKAVIFVTATKINEALELYEMGADYVILPHFLGGEHTSYIIENLEARKLLKTKAKHIEELRNRKSLKHEHPQR